MIVFWATGPGPSITNSAYDDVAAGATDNADDEPSDVPARGATYGVGVAASRKGLMVNPRPAGGRTGDASGSNEPAAATLLLAAAGASLAPLALALPPLLPLCWALARTRGLGRSCSTVWLRDPTPVGGTRRRAVTPVAAPPPAPSERRVPSNRVSRLAATIRRRLPAPAPTPTPVPEPLSACPCGAPACTSGSMPAYMVALAATPPAAGGTLRGGLLAGMAAAAVGTDRAAVDAPDTVLCVVPSWCWGASPSNASLCTHHRSTHTQTQTQAQTVSTRGVEAEALGRTWTLCVLRRGRQRPRLVR